METTIRPNLKFSKKTKIITIIIIFTLIFMPNRYKKVEFKNFSKGQTKNEFDDPSFYKAINNIAVDENTQKLSLLPALDSTNINDDGYGDAFAENGTYAFSLVYTTASDFSNLYRSTDGITFTKIYDFPATSIPISLFAIDKQIVAFLEVGALIKVAVSSNNGTSFTITTVPNDYKITKITKKDGLYYGHAITTGASILTSTDFINWTVVLLTSIDETIYGLRNFKGFIHYTLQENFYRLENDLPVLIKSFKNQTYSENIGEKGYLITEGQGTNINIHIYDGEETKKFGPISGLGDTAIVLFSTENYAIIAVFTFATSALYTFYKVFFDGSIFKIYSLTVDYSPTGGGNFKGLDLIQHTDTVGSTLQIYRSEDYVLSGTFETTIQDLGEHIPIAIILKHNPLSASTSVKMYKKSDRASSWGSALFTSDVDGAVKYIYKFPAGTKQDFIEFKIELITTDLTKAPKDIQFEFLYLPSGLETSK